MKFILIIICCLGLSGVIFAKGAAGHASAHVSTSHATTTTHATVESKPIAKPKSTTRIVVEEKSSSYQSRPISPFWWWLYFHPRSIQNSNNQNQFNTDTADTFDTKFNWPLFLGVIAIAAILVGLFFLSKR